MHDLAHGAGSGESAASTTELSTSRGRVSVTDAVVRTIASVAARRAPDVYGLSGVPGAAAGDRGEGVEVELHEGEAAIRVGIVVEYGARVEDVAQAVRREVAELVNRMTGLVVVQVDVVVSDVHVRGDEPVPRPERVR